MDSNLDKLSPKICLECLDKVYSAYDIRKLCIESDAYLRKTLSDNTIETQSKECENPTDENIDNRYDDLKWDEGDIGDELNLLEIDLDDRKVLLNDLPFEEGDAGIKSDISDGSSSTPNSLKGHKCPTCDKTFQCEATLNKHIFTHKKISNCPICSKKFSNTRYLLEN